jgi:hypothetical protein
MLQRWLLTGLLFALASHNSLADTFTVIVRVQDAQGRPVAKANAALYWDVKNGAMVPRPNMSGITDAAGRAVLTVDNWNEKRPALVLSADRKLGAVVGISKEDDGRELTVELAGTVRLMGALRCSELKRAPEWANTMIAPLGYRAFFSDDEGTAAKFSFVLPVGEYKVWICGTDVVDLKQTISVSVRPVQDLGTLDLKANTIAKLRGKRLFDFVVSDARGAKKDLKLGNYKGKWLYVEFWGYW